AGRNNATFAPVLTTGEIVETLWQRLFERAGGHIVTATSDDPDLHLVVDGARVDPVAGNGAMFVFRLRESPRRRLLIRSRSGVPSLVGQGRSDHRRLGIALSRLVLDNNGVLTSFEHDMPQLREGGCYAAEVGFAWTDGDFALPSRFFVDLTGSITLT